MEAPLSPPSPAAGLTTVFSPHLGFFARSVRFSTGPNWLVLLDENLAYPPGVVNAAHNLFTPTQIARFSLQAPPASLAPFGPQSLQQTSLSWGDGPVTESPGTVQQQQTVIPIDTVAPVTINTALVKTLAVILSNQSGSPASVNVTWLPDGTGGGSAPIVFTLNTNNTAFLACGVGTVCNLGQTVPVTFPITGAIAISTNQGFQVYGRMYY